MATNPFFIVGSSGQKAGRLTPFIRPIFKTVPARSAPVEPILTIAPISSSFFSNSNAFTKELSFLCLIASVGLSSQVMTSFASNIDNLLAS